VSLHLLNRHIFATVYTQLWPHGAVCLLVSGESLLLNVLSTHLALDFGIITISHVCLKILELPYPLATFEATFDIQIKDLSPACIVWEDLQK
jgi:hypothetical protein